MSYFHHFQKSSWTYRFGRPWIALSLWSQSFTVRPYYQVLLNEIIIFTASLCLARDWSISNFVELIPVNFMVIDDGLTPFISWICFSIFIYFCLFRWKKKMDGMGYPNQLELLVILQKNSKLSLPNVSVVLEQNFFVYEFPLRTIL